MTKPIISLDHLQQLDKDTLGTHMQELGLQPDGRESKETRIKRIVEFTQIVQPSDLINKDNAPPRKPEVDPVLSQEDIHGIIAPFLKRGMQVRYSDEGWHFTGMGGKEDSGNYQIPRIAIKHAAQAVMQGVMLGPEINEKLHREFD